MKLTNLERQKYPIYLLIVPNLDERRKSIDLIKKNEERFYFASEEYPQAVLEMQSMSLFSQNKTVIIDGVDSLSKEEIKGLIALISKGVNEVTLILGAQGKKGILELIKLVDKNGAIFDLSSEKPWDKDKRFVSSLQKKAFEKGKGLSSQCVFTLFERVGKDYSILEKEVEKLICFIGEKKNIEPADIQQISSSTDLDTVWKIATEVVWENRFEKNKKIDPNFFYALVAALRSEYRIGYKICNLLSRGEKDLSSFFPRVWPKALEKKRVASLQKGVSYFQNGLKQLFAIELKAKDNVSCYSALIQTYLR